MDELATLKLYLVEDVPAHALKEIIDIVDTIYINNVWLDKAEQFEGVIPDDYPLQPEEWLDISELEIGTPNFIEFIGQGQYLMPALAFVAATLGLPKIILEIIKLPGEIKKGRLDRKKTKLEIKKLERDHELANVVKEEIDVGKTQKGFMQKTESVKNKISEYVYDFKKGKEEELVQKPYYYLPTYLEKDKLPQMRIYTTTTTS